MCAQGDDYRTFSATSWQVCDSLTSPEPLGSELQERQLGQMCTFLRIPMKGDRVPG